MKILHTADLHLGQILYQNYDREDEHEHFFNQLEKWCHDEHPDALLVSGDVFDIQQPSAGMKRFFNERFVSLARQNPGMTIVVTAGNHDSASRIQADSPVWSFADAHLVGVPPTVELSETAEGWEDRFIIRLESGYIIALPYYSGERKDIVQAILDRVARENTDGKPIVMMAHLAITGTDVTGHGEIGNLRTFELSTMGSGWDYLALGHIHKPQTLGHQEDAFMESVSYPSGVARYSGSVLHVSCDETYPHTVSVVEIPSHGADVSIRQLQIDELRHFFVLPEAGNPFKSQDEVMEAIRAFCEKIGRGYFRLRLDAGVVLDSNINQQIYELIASCDDEVRYNPKPIWEGKVEEESKKEKPVFEVAELQQMTDPLVFIEKTLDQYPGIDMDMLRDAFAEVRNEMVRMENEEKVAQAKKAEKKNKKNNAQDAAVQEEEKD